MAYLCEELPFERSEIFEPWNGFAINLHSKLCGHTAQETFDRAQNAIKQGRIFKISSVDIPHGGLGTYMEQRRSHCGKLS